MKSLPFLAAAGLIAGLFASGCSSTAQVQEVVRTDTVYVEVPVEPSAEAPTSDLRHPTSDLPIEAGRFDFGKMWTFDNPPLDYFREEYDFAPDEAWFQKARSAALRIEGCTASFISGHGLVMTNHHCARESVTAVEEEGENFLDNGFYAATLADERPIPDGYAERLISITDVTDEIRAAETAGQTSAERADARTSAIAAIEERLTAEAGGEDVGFLTEVISLYNGGMYSAYVFKRYDDVRLVMAPEVEIAYFGGDPDNFTYPRYNLDVSFYRVYENDAPVEPEHFFSWSTDGTSEGDAVFVVGNPGSTNRLQTVAELEYRRDYEDRIILRLLESRVDAMHAFMEDHPEEGREIDLQNTIFSLENSIKASRGTLEGLENPELMARKMDAEADLREAISADSALSAKYGGLFEETAELQAELAEVSDAFGAFVINPDAPLYSTVAIRSALGALYSAQIRAGVPEQALADLREQILGLEPYPKELEKRLVKARLDDLVYYLGEGDPQGDMQVAQLLAGRSTEAAAADIVENTAVLDEDFDTLLPEYISSYDAAIDFGIVIAQGLSELQQVTAPITARQAEISAEIARARFEVYGTTFPPDASFSLRISDGVVASYEYNGTIAPAYTTFYGLYDRHFSHGADGDWDVPSKWLDPDLDVNLSTPLNLVTTNDIIGGNSGSPLLNRNLEIVGLVFDGNIESLPGEFIYTDEAARTVAVDSRGIMEALSEAYGARRLVDEILEGVAEPR